MNKNNITFGAHTVTHRALSELDRHDAASEIIGSKSALEEILGETVKYFAYPYGKMDRDFNDETVRIIEESGFVAAFSMEKGCINSNSSIYALNRIGVRNLPLFVFKVRTSGILETRIFYLLRKYM